MILEFNRFYRNYGIRRPTQLTNPPITHFNQLSLPRMSSIHFPQWDEEDFEVPQDHFLLKTASKAMYFETLTDYTSPPLGGPILMPGNVRTTVQRFISSNSRIWRYKDDDVYLSPVTITIHTYAILNRRYNYRSKKRDTGMNKWLNHWNSVFTNVSKRAKDGRNHFVILDVPEHIPSINRLRQYSNLDARSVRYYRRPDHWMVVSLWNLFMPDSPDAYIFKDLDMSVLGNINIIWKLNNLCTVVNLGTLASYNQHLNPDAPLTPIRFMKRLLNLFLLIKEATLADNISSSENVFDNEVQVEEDLDADLYKEGISEEEVEEDSIDLDDLFKDIETTPIVNNSKTDKSWLQNAKSRNLSVDDDSLEDIDEDADSLENQLDERLAILEDLDDDEDDTDENQDITAEQLAYKPYVSDIKDTTQLDETVIELAAVQARQGRLTAGELRHATKLASKYKTLKDPRDPKKKFIDSLIVTNEDISFDRDVAIANDKVSKVVPDLSMHKSSLKEFDSKYIKEVMPKHIAKTVMDITKIGVTVQDYDIERVQTVTDDFEIHSIRLTTIAGKQSTLRFRLPVVNEDGEFFAGGTKYRFRKQWGDLPIRKIGPEQVAMTSYYSKLFVKRSERATANLDKWFLDQLVSRGIDSEDNSILDLKLNNVFDNYAKLPREYSMVSKRVSSFVAQGYRFYFNINKLEENFTSLPKGDGIIPVAKALDNDKDVIVMDKNSGLIKVEGKWVDFIDFIGFNTLKQPVEYVELSLFKKTIPLVFLLGYQLGLGNLLATMNVKFERMAKVPGDMYKTHLVVRFKDEYLVFNKQDKRACLMFAGLNRFHNDIRKYSVYDFDNKEVYSSVFENNGINLRFLKECNIMFKMWVDHITHDVLVDMGEPTDLVLLFIRATEMLLDDQHPDSMDTAYLRIKGYERFCGILYSELIKEVRNFNNKPNRKDKAFSINPEAVWYEILKDQSKAPVEESNPMHNMKEKEVVVYRGAGGRSGRSMVASARKYHKNAIGTVSEATVDSADVGTVVYLSGDPNLSNLYGRVIPIEANADTPPAKMLSSSALLSPGADIDD